MTDFFHSWAFWFIIGCFVGACFGVVLAAILAASGRASRMEERISDEAIHEAAKREEARIGESETEIEELMRKIVVINVPEKYIK